MTTSGWKRAAAIGLLGACLAGGLLGLRLINVSRVHQSGEPYVRSFLHVRSAVDKNLRTSDGMAFAALARDPTLSRPEEFVDGPHEAAYRAQRPLFGYVVWVVSAGQGSAVPVVMSVLVVIAAGTMTAMTAAFIMVRGGRGEAAIVVVVLPGCLRATTGVTPEMIGMTFALLGIFVWEQDSRALATCLFALSVLTRESMIVVPFAVMLHAFVTRRTPLRQLFAPLVVPAAAFGAWCVVVRVRFGAWPTTGRVPDRLGLPLQGLFSAASHWIAPAQEIVVIVITVASVVGALVVSRRDVMTWVVVSYAAFGSLMGAAVWGHWYDYGRPLVPLYVCALIVIASRWRAGESEPLVTGGETSRVG